MTAHDRLTRRLLDLHETGHQTPCEVPDRGDLWFAEKASARDLAAQLCRSCPVLDPCAAAADETDEKFGVWGGRDRTATTTKTKKGRP